MMKPPVMPLGHTIGLPKMLSICCVVVSLKVVAEDVHIIFMHELL